ncbi:MAG: cytochrome b [Methylophilaceae bacterium]|nr:cytochrome b [Methylophilaceae bacterium]
MTSVATNQARYSKVMMLLHWAMLLLIIAVFAFIEGRELFEKGTEAREFMKTTHYMLGLTVLFAVIIRLVVRFSSQIPPIEPTPHWALKRLGQTMHIVLYVLMLGMPIAGWLMLSAAGKPIPFFGLELPALIGENEALADQIKDAHKTVGSLAYYLIAAHALAGLYHHYMCRDNTLLRMMPAKSK